ncbi:MAG: response regulator transcription factor [Gammaproteobacteria bacterium]|nr:MAG: response regulator transcription factor [Gammaproteobacteria bacterium]
MSENRTILLVDDDTAVRHALSIFLNTSGYNVRTYASAEAYLDDVEGGTEGVMLLDLRMPGMSGLELQSELTRRGINIPIIFLSGHSDAEMSVMAIKAGAIGFLEKPFGNGDLLATIREAFSVADDN